MERATCVTVYGHWVPDNFCSTNAGALFMFLIFYYFFLMVTAEVFSSVGLRTVLVCWKSSDLMCVVLIKLNVLISWWNEVCTVYCTNTKLRKISARRMLDNYFCFLFLLMIIAEVFVLVQLRLVLLSYDVCENGNLNARLSWCNKLSILYGTENKLQKILKKFDECEYSFVYSLFIVFVKR